MYNKIEGDDTLNVDFERTLLNESTETIPKEFINQADLYRQVMQRYYAAIKQVRTKLEILNDELQVSTRRTPIETIKVGLKSPESIIKKMTKQGLEKTLENLDKIGDIAGIRVITTYVDDIYDIASMFLQQADVKLLKITDYIKKPKESGYRSLHLDIETPIYFSKERVMVKVEVQIRTIAMDFWASLEHDMKYKVIINGAEDLKQELKSCADDISKIDIKMQNIKRKLRELEDEVI